jgi:lysophospholipid acyltransferase
MKYYNVALIAIIIAGITVNAANLQCPTTKVQETAEEVEFQKQLSAQFLGHQMFEEYDPFLYLDQHIDVLSAKVGIPCDVIRYFMGSLFCYVLAIGHTMLPDNNVTLKHGYSLFWGLFLSYACFGVNTLLPLMSSLIVFVTCKMIGNYRFTPAIIFVVSMGITSFCHIYRLMIDYGGYTLDISGPQMVITIKLTSFAWNVFDYGKKHGDKYKHRIQNSVDISNVSTLEFFSFIFFFGGYLGGPAFEFQDYIRFTNNELFEDKKKPSLGTRIIPALSSFCTSIFFLVIFQTVAKQYDPFFLLCEDFALMPVYKQLVVIWLSVSLNRSKYYCVWNLADGAMVLCGFGYNGRDKKTNLVKWDRMVNAHYFDVEFGESSRQAVTSWNLRTSYWLRIYSYERLLEGNYGTTIAMYVTMMVSAFWHGFYGGYYVTFGCGAWLQSIGKSLRRTLRPIFENYETGKTPMWYNFGGRIITAILLNFLTVSFFVISVPNALKIWSATGYIGLYMMVATQICIKLITLTKWHQKLSIEYKNVVAERRKKKKKS